MAAADTKELAQCLAFAYFAENPNINEPDHAVRFYSLFSGKENVTRYKTKYLSKQFPIDKVKSEFKVTETKTKKISYHTTAKKVYNVAKDCISNGLFKYNVQDYEFLDQNDPFVLFVKDKCLENIKKAFKLTYKIDALSAIDVFFVKKSSKDKILKDFKENFSDTEKILKNSIWNDGTNNDYTSLTEKYMNSGELIPISLKLPVNISDKTQIKRVQFNPKKDAAIEVDPYIKFLAAILDDPSKTKQYIEKVIDIDYDSFSTGDFLNWVFPVYFRYTNLIDPVTKKPLADYNLKFNLFAQGYGAGWNGQFDVSSKKYQSTQWVGGVGPTTFEDFAKSYSEYRSVVKKLSTKRVSALESFCAQYKKKYPVFFKENAALYSKVVHELSAQKIIKKLEDQKSTIAFFNQLQDTLENQSKSISLYHQYKLKLIDDVRDTKKKYSGSYEKQEKYIDAHYVHAQVSYFILDGGPRFQSYFKQRMFITIFGIITKKSHKLIDSEDYPEMRNIIQKVISDNNPKIKAEFSTSPHFIIS